VVFKGLIELAVSSSEKKPAALAAVNKDAGKLRFELPTIFKARGPSQT
jgi:hypothetical protein